LLSCFFFFLYSLFFSLSCPTCSLSSLLC
jgi:hypothetical protein